MKRYRYHFFRNFRHAGLLREWSAEQIERRYWSEPYAYPGIKLPDEVIFEGMHADLQPSWMKMNRYVRVRNTYIEHEKKVRRLNRRRQARRQKHL